MYIVYNVILTTMRSINPNWEEYALFCDMPLFWERLNRECLGIGMGNKCLFLLEKPCFLSKIRLSTYTYGRVNPYI